MEASAPETNGWIFNATVITVTSTRPLQIWWLVSAAECGARLVEEPKAAHLVPLRGSLLWCGMAAVLSDLVANSARMLPLWLESPTGHALAACWCGVPVPNTHVTHKRAEQMYNKSAALSERSVAAGLRGCLQAC